jgi:hypothetical protein
MNSAEKVRLLAAVSFVVILTVAGIGVYCVATSPPSRVLLPATAVLAGMEIAEWNATFLVPSPGGRLIGSFTAFDGAAIPSLVAVNGSSVPDGSCYFGGAQFDEFNGTVNTPLSPGVYTAYWSRCFMAKEVVVTQPIQIVLGAAP